MDTKNIILAVIFTFSILLLWESWSVSNLDVPVSEDNTTINQGVTTSNTNNFSEVPKPTVLNSNDSSEIEFSPTENIKPNKDEFLSIENNDLKLSIDLKGARIIYVELLTQVSEDYEEGHVILFSNRQSERYEAQTGLFAFPGGGDIYPNHTSNFTVDTNANNAPNSVTLVSEVNNIKLIKEISLEKNVTISFKKSFEE